MEPILTPNEKRFCIYPISHDDLWAAYKRSVACFWTVEEIELDRDKAEFNNQLTKEEQDFIKFILAFFASSDGIVNENIAERFLREVQYPEARCFYTMQLQIESIHSEMYSLLIDTLVADVNEKERLFHATKTISAVAAKADWALKWIQDGNFAERLVAFACVEGIHFSSSFCAIYWLKSRGICLNGLGKSNEFIARDEGLHRDFALLLYRNHLESKLSTQRFHEIVRSAVQVEQLFVRESLTLNLRGMNQHMMCDYVEFVADHLLKSAGVDPLFNTANPFLWMESISLEGKSNFFECRVSEYAKQQSSSVALEECFDAEF